MPRFLPWLAGLLLLLALGLLPHGGVALATDWSSALDESDVTTLFETIERIRKAGDVEAALPLLMAATVADHGHIAVAAGEALRSLSQDALDETLLKDKGFKKWWRKALKEKDGARQINLARVLSGWGHPIVDEAMAHLAAGRRGPDVQTEALFLCAALNPTKKHPFPKTRKSVLEALKKGRTDEIKCAACSAAGLLGLTEGLDLLESMVTRDRDDYAGLYAVWAMRQIGWTGGIGSFVHVLGSNPKKTTRQANLKAVTELSTLKDVPELISLSRSNKKDYRDAACLALGRLPWRSVRGRLPSQALDHQPVTTGFENKEGKAKHALPEPALDIPEEVIDRLIQVVREDREWEVRDAARQALLRFGKRAADKVRATMPDLIDFSDEDTALTAIELAGIFGAQDAYDDLLKTARYEKKSRALRMFAARALEGLDPARATKDLMDGLKPRKSAKDHEVSSVRALGYLRHRDAFDALLAIATDPDHAEEMRREAEFGLERLTGRRFGRKRDVWTKYLERTPDAFYPGLGTFDRSKNKKETVSAGKFGLTQRTERAVEDGLRWLERQQHPLGFWDGNEKGFGGVVNCEPAYTGLSLLAFLGAGYNGNTGKYSLTIRRATEFVAATQFYDGGFPVTGGGDDSWIYAYLIAMAVWGLNEGYAMTGDPRLMEPAQWGIDYLVRVQTPGKGWRYGPRYYQSDTSCTSWVLMATKMADLIGLDVAQKSWDGIDDWLERCTLDLTGETEKVEDLSSDYDYEVGGQRYFKAFTGYFELSESDNRGLQKISMTSVGMVCRFFMGWKRSHPYMIGCANFLRDFLPQWMGGLEKDQNVAWYHYYWYYGTLAMHQMGGKNWRAWNQKIKRMYPEKQRQSPPDLAGSWDPDPTVLNGGRIFSTAMSILSLETYYRFSPLLEKEPEAGEEDEGGAADSDADK